MSKNTKIFLVVFSAFLIIVTTSAIVYNRKNHTTDESHIIIESGNKVPSLSESNIENQSTKGAMLSDTYAANGLKYEYIKDKENDIDINLVKISGLNNVEVQEEINREIKERIKKILDSNNFKKNSDDSAYVSTSIEANFADVLSIKIYVKFSETYSKCYGLNYRLDNGERLKFSDLFVYNAPKKNIVTAAAYKTFAMNYYTQEGMSNEFYTNIEGDVLEFLIDYDNEKITEFSFSPLCVELYREGKTVVIDMIDYYQYISIFNEYVSTSNLYEDVDGIPKKIPVFMSRPDSLYDLYEKVNDSCILDVIIYSDEVLSSDEKKVVAKYKKDLESRLSIVKSERGVYYSNYVKVTKDIEDNENILIFEENECFATSDAGNFENSIYNVILAAERDKNNKSFNKSKIYFLEEDMLKTGVGVKKYSVKTAKEIEEIDENSEEESNENESSEENENSNNEVEDTQNNQNYNVINNEIHGTERPGENDDTSVNITTQVIY